MFFNKKITYQARVFQRCLYAPYLETESRNKPNSTRSHLVFDGLWTVVGEGIRGARVVRDHHHRRKRHHL